MNVGKARIGSCEGWVDGTRLLIKRLHPRLPLGSKRVVDPQAPKEQIVGPDVLRGPPPGRSLACIHHPLRYRRDNALRDLFLDGENVLKSSVVLFSPEMRP